jgi:hypothetical protein
MQIKYKKTIKGIFFIKIVYLLIVSGIVICVVGSVNIQAAQAESFLRVCKHGVIYYYFSNTGETSNRDFIHIINRGISVNHPQVRQRLTAQELEPWIRWASRNHKLPASLIKAVIRVESNFNPVATSPKGAQGLMQLMPGTAEQLQVANPYDIRENIWGGTSYLGMLLRRFNNNLVMALAAYNAGPKRVEQCQGIPAIAETQGFVRDVCANFLHYSKGSQVRPGSKTLAHQNVAGQRPEP